jgi:hypothetical protein
VTVSKAASARTELIRARKLVHRSSFALRAGRSVRSLRLPARLRPGRFAFRLGVRDATGTSHVLRRWVVVRR